MNTHSQSDEIDVTESIGTPGVSFWKHERSPSDTLVPSDTFSTPSVFTYRTDVSRSETVGVTESLSKPVDTWKHILSFADTLAPSDSFSKNAFTYRTDVSRSETLAPSESLTVVGNNQWRFITNPTDNLNPTESLSKSVETFHYYLNNSDEQAISDSLNVQIKVGTDSYYYDTINLENATKTVGYISGGDFTTSSSLVSSPESLTDGQTHDKTTFSGSNYAGVRFDLSTAKPFDFFAVHLASGINDSIKLYASNSQGSGYSQIINAYNSSDKWTVNEFDEQTYRSVSYTHLTLPTKA